MSALLILTVKIYRNILSYITLPSCRYRPTCSDYAEEALSRHGVFRGGGLTLWRLLRCHPLTRGGIDLVP